MTVYPMIAAICHSEARDCPVNQVGDPSWFCVRSHPKHEHIAAAHLANLTAVDVFHPRIRYARPTRRGLVTATESLFPGYLFARFDWQASLNAVRYSSGVAGVVHFGAHWPTVSEHLIGELRMLFGNNEILHVPSGLSAGDTVLVARGVFEGLEAVVTQILPGRQRVAVLLDFLGRQTTVEFDMEDLQFDNLALVVKELNPDT